MAAPSQRTSNEGVPDDGLGQADRSEPAERESKSTGPTSATGKQRVRLNALTHGLTARTVVLPGEDAEALQRRVEAFKDDVQPRGALEDYLVERAAHVSWQLDRAERTIAARLTDAMLHGQSDAANRQADEVAVLAPPALLGPRRTDLRLPPPAGLRPPPPEGGLPVEDGRRPARSRPDRQPARGHRRRLPMAARPLGRPAVDPRGGVEVAAARPAAGHPAAGQAAARRRRRRAGHDDLPGLLGDGPGRPAPLPGRG